MKAFAFPLTTLLILAAGDFSLNAKELTGSRPNIVLVMTDDQGYGDLACHGNPILRTPHLDRIFREAVRFTDFHVSPTCAPTRAALMTGRHEFKSGVTHTIQERERLSLDATTFVQLLKAAGYSTGIFGKWHLGDEPVYQPNRRGFDEVFIHGGGGIGQTYPGSCGDAPDNTYFDPALLHNGRFVKTQGYCTDLFFAEARRWIEQRSERSEPFFAYICPNAPHSPLVSPGPEYDAIYEGKRIDGHKLDAGAVAYYSMITNIDENIGRLLATLEKLGVAQNTLIIFMTDNGGTHTRLHSAGMRGGKGTPYQGGTRVPCFWRWPGMLPSGVDIDKLAAHIDLFPTLAALAGVPVPENLSLDGRNLLPLLVDPEAAWSDRYVFIHLGRWSKGEVEAAKFTSCAVRNSRFRFVNNRELYDLAVDPEETTNVIDQHPELVADLQRTYDRWWDDVRPGMVNEQAVGPEVNPFKELYWRQFGGGPVSIAN